MKFRNTIRHLHTLTSACSSGCGDGPLLLQVLCGIKTGCPLLFVVFSFCVNPFGGLFEWLSDNPGFSVTRVCAGDFGLLLPS